MTTFKKIIIAIGATIVAIGGFLAAMFSIRSNQQVKKNTIDVAQSKTQDVARTNAINAGNTQIDQNNKVIADNAANAQNRDNAIAEGNAQIAKNQGAIDEANKILGSTNTTSK